MDRFWARLDDVHLFRFTVLGPFDIHRAAVMFLDSLASSGEGEDFIVAQYQGGGFGARGGYRQGRLLWCGGAAAGVDHFFSLGTSRAFYHVSISVCSTRSV